MNRAASRQLSGLALLVAMLLVFEPGSAVVWPLDEGDSVVGELIDDRLRGDDTLVDIARMHNIGHFEIRQANPDIDPWLPYPGRRVRIPQLHVLPDGPHEGIVVNLAERRLYFFTDSWPDWPGPVVSTHPVGVGLFDRATPLIETRVTARLDNPAWYPTADVRAWYAARGEPLPPVVPPGPENPLGRHALVLDGDGLLIHGTHRPAGVGMRVSQGCIRLYPESIANLIQQVPIGTPVRIIDQPTRLGWRGEELFVEVDPLDESSEAGPAAWAGLERRILQAAASRLDVEIDWVAARRVFERADSVPDVVARAGGRRANGSNDGAAPATAKRESAERQRRGPTRN